MVTLVREGEMSVGNSPEVQVGASPPAFPADSLTSDRLRPTGNTVSATVNLTPYSHLKIFLMSSMVIVMNVSVWRLYNGMSQCLGDLHNSMSEYFPHDNI